MKQLSRQELFKIGEDIATRYLVSIGYKVVCRNYRQSCGEIDLIVEKNQLLVFCEIKTRSYHSLSSAMASVSYTKQKKITLTAQKYISQNAQFGNYYFRFDVVVVFYSAQAEEFSVHHYPDAFYPILGS